MATKTDKSIAYEVNCTTGEITERERTEAELAREAVEQAAANETIAE